MRRVISQNIGPHPIVGVFLTQIIDEIRIVRIGIRETDVSRNVHDECLEVHSKLHLIAVKPQSHSVIESPGTCAVAKIVGQNVAPILATTRIVAQIIESSGINNPERVVARGAVTNIIVTPGNATVRARTSDICRRRNSVQREVCVCRTIGIVVDHQPERIPRQARIVIVERSDEVGRVVVARRAVTGF